MKVQSCNNSNPVNVTYVAEGPNAGWNLQHCLTSGGPGHYPALSAGFNDQPTFKFDITNLPGVTFAATNPVWVTVGANKPTQLDPGLINSIQGAGTRSLSFKDLNNYNGGDPATLTYTLRFSNNTATDPIIQNGGCCHIINQPGFLPMTETAFLIDLAIAFIVGVILTLVVQRLRRG